MHQLSGEPAGDAKDSSAEPHELGGPRGYERGDERFVAGVLRRDLLACGNQAQVPFKPRMDRPSTARIATGRIKPD